MGKIRITAALTLLSMALFLGLGCSGASAYEGTGKKAAASSGKLAGKLVITGSGTMAPMVAEIAKRFQRLHPEVQIDVQAGGSGRGLSDARQGKADIGMVSRALTEEEGDVYGYPIARDGICMVVHKDNPVQTLTSQQVVKIYTGKIANWKKVGGKDTPIAVMNAEAGRSSAELFTHYFDVKYDDVKAQRVLGDNPARIKAIAENPEAIIYMSVGEAERSAQAGAPIKLLPLDGVAATSKNIRSGNFPISRALTLVSKELPKGLVKEFINFSLSPQVTEIIVKHDFVPYLD